MPTGHYRYQCQPAHKVIRTVGGVRLLAEILGLTPEAVSQWNRPVSKGGTGGYIPRKHWDAIRDCSSISLKWLRTGKREEVSMGRASKQKGDRFEYQVVEDLIKHGFGGAHRVPLSGAVKGYPGDVLVKGTKTGDWVLQCKINKSETGGGRGGVAKFLSEVSIGTVRTKSGLWLVAMHQNVFIDLMNGKTPKVVNMPVLVTSGASIEAHIKGHDALVFRKDGVRTWSVLVTAKKFAGI